MAECWFFVGCWVLGILLVVSVASNIFFSDRRADMPTPPPNLPQLIQDGLAALAREYPILRANQKIAAADEADYQAKLAAAQEAGERANNSAQEVTHGTQTVENLKQSIRDAIDALFNTGEPAGTGQPLQDAIDAPGPVPLTAQPSELQILSALAGKIDLLSESLSQLGERMYAGFDALKAQVQATTDLEQSAVVLIQGLASQIIAAKDDPVKLAELTNNLKISADALAAAVVSNTPAGPPLPEPVPPPGPSPEPVPTPEPVEARRKKP